MAVTKVITARACMRLKFIGTLWVSTPGSRKGNAAKAAETVTDNPFRVTTQGARHGQRQFWGNSGVRMEERLSTLEARVDAMAGSLERIEARLDALETRPISASEESGAFVSFERADEPAAQIGAGESLEVVPILNLVGQICLVLCGAFLIRTLTGVGAVPTELGLAVGPFYAAGWLFYADLLARRGKLRAANFYGGASVVIAYPLAWEAATNFGVLSTLGSAVALSIIWPIALGVAWRRELRDFAWVATLGALGTLFALLASTHELVPVAAALVLLGAGTVWVSYSRGWRGLWWLPAIAADLLIIHMVYLVSRPYSLPEWETGLSTEAVIVLGLSLFVL